MQKHPHHGGIYMITNMINGKRYIGSSYNLSKRKSTHLWALRKGVHVNRHLQSAFDKHGEKVFLFTVLERCATADLILREQWYLDNFKPEYNVALFAGSPTKGLKTPHSLETKARISASLRGHATSAETREKISQNNGSRNPEVREKISLANKGRKLSPEAVEKIRAASRGRRHTPEALERMSAAQSNRSEETRAKLSAAMKSQWARKRAEES